MEQLIADFSHLDVNARKIWYNNTDHHLVYINDIADGDHVYTHTFIPQGEMIGILEGVIVPTRVLVMDKYCFWISDYEILDCRRTPRCILAMIQEALPFGIEPNCKAIISYTGEHTVVFIYAIKDIRPGDELFIDIDYS